MQCKEEVLHCSLLDMCAAALLKVGILVVGEGQCVAYYKLVLNCKLVRAGVDPVGKHMGNLRLMLYRH